MLFEENLARKGFDQTDNDVKRGGLPGAVRTEQTDDLPCVQLNGDLVYNSTLAVLLDNLFCAENHVFRNNGQS